MFKINEQLKVKLDRRKKKDYFRSLPKEEIIPTKEQKDFFSNDYLGFARDPSIKALVEEALKNDDTLCGSTGSRLISGNSTLVESLENKIAKFHHSESALIFNSGYNANVGICSSLAAPGDVILFDELCHASIRDGLKLSRGETISFKHNDLEDLAEKLSQFPKTKVVVIESIYSMDGDVAPIKEILSLCHSCGVAMIVDEAHALGIYGKNGDGLVQELQLEEEIFARVVTYGKALGTHGAAVLGSQLLKNYLINYAHSFIYTTALPAHCLWNISIAYDFLKKEEYRNALHSNIQYFLQELTPEARKHFVPSQSPIQSIVVPGNEQVKSLSNKLQKAGFLVKPILFPTVPLGKERIRFSIHSFNKRKIIKELTNLLNEYFENTLIIIQEEALSTFK